MNIFVLSRNVCTCAQMHCDQHICKMPLETAQLLSTALHIADPARHAALHAAGLAYKPTHANHPCALWARECLNNYLWLGALGLALCGEYSYRYARPGADKQHKTLPVLQALVAERPPLPRQRCITPFALALPDDCKLGDPVASYRSYYILHKSAFARWTRREPPDWYVAALAARGEAPRFKAG